MKTSELLRGIIFLVVIILTLGFQPLLSENEEIKLTVFYPSTGTVQNLLALREKGFIDLPQLKVSGVYHIKEVTNYEQAKSFVESKGIDWFKFKPLSADLNEKNIYGANALTAELEEIIKNSDGIIFFGGPDIPPALFGEKTSLLTQIEDPFRHYLELSAIFHFLGGFQDESFKPLLEAKPFMPVLGICLGAQSLNAGTGGTLIQDIWSEVYGRNFVEDIIALGPDRWHNNPFIKLHPEMSLTGYNFHWIKLLPDKFFVKTLGFSSKDKPRILSAHHQAIGKLGKGFEVVASSPDGKVIEAIHHIKFPNVLGVQFHPEHYRLWDESLQVRMNPDDKPFSYREILTGNPPSLEFHKRIWEWFSEVMKENHSQHKTENKKT